MALKLFKGTKMTNKPAAKTKLTDEQVMPQAILIDELTKHYGIEFTAGTDKEQYIRDLTKESHRVVKEFSDRDPRKEAYFEEKIGKLRELWADDLSEKPTDEQAELKQKLEDEGYKVNITFPDAETYLVQANGKEDSGSMTAGIPAIVGVVERMVNPAGY